MTKDGRSKLHAVVSPSEREIAYYEQCPQSENCIPSIVILDLDGQRLKTFRPIGEDDPAPEPCGSSLDIFWLTQTSISALCHDNPSLSEYIETDLISGKTVRYLRGLDFTPSPDRKYIAHVGPIVHFAAPIFQSYYLYFDKTVVYPLPRGMRPTQKEPDVVRRRGSIWTGVHQFVSRLFWSPDSTRVALVDCLFDWIEKGVADDGATPVGDRTNRRCYVAVVAGTGKSILFPIGPISEEDGNNTLFSWDSPTQLSTSIAGATSKFRLPKN